MKFVLLPDAPVWASECRLGWTLSTDSQKNRSPVWIAIGCLILLTSAYLWLMRFEKTSVFRPSRQWLNPTLESLIAPEDVFLTTSDGVRIHGWFLAANSKSPRRHLALLLLHGNTGNWSQRLPMLELLSQTGMNILAVDYRGYGRSEGTSDEPGTYLDAEAGWAWLVQRGFAPDQIIVHGESLGGGVAAGLVCRKPVGGLILQSTFTSVPDLGAERYPWLPVRTIGRVRYPTRKRLMEEIRVPLLILHSPTDEVIPFRHAETNLAAAHDPKMFWELHASHGDYLKTDAGNLLKGIQSYLDRFFPASKSPSISVSPPVA